jgi:hypothetical protein
VTTTEVFGAVLRRWYLMLLGAALTLGAMVLVNHQQGVYWTQFNVVLIGPTLDEDPNYLKNARFSLDEMVGVVAADLNRGDEPLVTASVDAIMVGAGEREGVEVRVPNQGSQWEPQFNVDHLDIQVAGDSPAAVSKQARRTTAAISRSLERRQDELGISYGMRITALASSTDPQVFFIGASRTRSLAVAALAGAAITTALVVQIDRLLRRRRKSDSRDT